MALVGRRDGRNFGYGRQLSYAGPQALKDMFGGGHYGTVKAHCDRWLAFVKWCSSEQGPGINDARQIDRKVLADYAAYLRDVVGRGGLAISTAQNRLSSINRTMAEPRDDQYVKLPTPSKALGMQRSVVRRSVPHGQDREQVKQIVDVLCSHHQLRATAIVLLGPRYEKLTTGQNSLLSASSLYFRVERSFTATFSPDGENCLTLSAFSFLGTPSDLVHAS